MLSFHASHLKFTAEKPIPWTLDGEYGGSHEINVVENCRQALTVMQGTEPPFFLKEPRSAGHGAGGRAPSFLMRLFPRQRDQVPNQADCPLGAHALFKSESMAVCPVLPRGQIGPVPIPLDGHHLFSRTLAPFPAVGSVAAADLLAPRATR